MRIPYAALRFSGEKKQTWVLISFGNKTIPTKIHLELYSKLGTFTQQTGILEGIANIKPLYLFLMPYSSFYVLMHVKDSRHLERRVRYQIWN
jgi:hypothetical protein